MRIDKFLWCVRRFKTRSISTEMINKDRVWINEQVARASRAVKIGDEIKIQRDGVTHSLKVLGIPPSRVGAKLVPEYITDTTSVEERDKEEFLRLMKKMNRPKGTGRPTKKDRRDIDRMNG